MKRRYLLIIYVPFIFICLFAFIGCSDETGVTPFPGNNSVQIKSLTNNSVVGDTLALSLTFQNKEGVRKVSWYVDGVLSVTDENAATFSNRNIIFTGKSIGSTITLYVTATDASGATVRSDSVRVYYLWRLLATDADEGNSKNIKQIFARSSATRVEFRVESFTPWVNPLSTTEGFSAGVYLDTDTNKNTGMQFDPLIPGTDANDIGPDLCAVTGFEGSGVFGWNSSLLYWQLLSSLKGLSLTSNSNVYEISVDRAVLNGAKTINILLKQLTQQAGVSKFDKVPDTGHINYFIDGLSFVTMPDIKPEQPLIRKFANGLLLRN